MANYYFRAKTTANYSAITTAGGSAVSWDKVGNTITITHNGHGLVNGDIINISVSSNELALPLGDYTVTRIDDNSFTITYSSTNILTGGTASADAIYSGDYPASNACDGNIATQWITDGSVFPHWWKYDLGAGVTKTVRRLRIYAEDDGTNVYIKDFVLAGSNNNVDWTDIYTGQHDNTKDAWVSFSFSNSTAYRYYRVTVSSNWLAANNYCQIFEFEMYEVPDDTGETATYTNYVWYDAETSGNKYDAKPDSDDDVTITSTNQCTLSGNEAAKTVTINASTTLSLATFNLDVSGLTTINGTLIMGNSGAGTGLTTVGLTVNSGSSLNLQTTSKINNSSNLSIHNSTIFSSNNRGIYTQTADGNYDNVNVNNRFISFTINTGITLILSQSSGQAQIGAASSGILTINGTIACGTKNIQLNAGSTGQIIIGENGDITGTSSMYFFCIYGATFIFNRLTKISFSGTISIISTAINNLVIPAWDFSGSDVTINGSSSAYDRYISSGTLKCKNFVLSNNNNGNVTLNMIENPSLEISGNIDLNAGAGTYTTLWIKGTGTITLKGSSGTQTLDLQNLTIEDIILDCAGATKQIILGATIDSLSGTGGTLNSSVAGTQRTLTVGATGVCSNVTFKDISVGSANKVNAKNNCTNLGNNLGIVFKDIVK